MLDDCLSSLEQQSLPTEEFEVIVVDNGSRDVTSEVAQKHGTRLQLRYQFEPEPGLHVGRHAGMQTAASDLLVFCDDDIIAEPTWLMSVVEAFDDPSVTLVGGNNWPLFELPPPGWLQTWWERPRRRRKALSQLSILDFGEGQFEIDPGFVWGCNFSVRRQALVDAGGFHPDGLPTDRLRWRGDGETHVSNWIRRSGNRALFHSGASVGHRVPAERMTLDYFVGRGYAQGISDSYTDLRRRQGAGANWSQRNLHRGRIALRGAASMLAGPHGRTGREMREVQSATYAAWLSGYDFHQREAASDPALMAWVLREDYY